MPRELFHSRYSLRDFSAGLTTSFKVLAKRLLLSIGLLKDSDDWLHEFEGTFDNDLKSYGLGSWRDCLGNQYFGNF